MTIVIDISEERFRDIQRIAEVQRESNHFKTAEQIVANGTPLPKGHGRLIDAQKLNDEMYHAAFETDTPLQRWDSGCWIRYKMFEVIGKKQPTIIEADAESEDKE